MSNPTISLTYEQVMNAIHEGHQETKKVIQDFVKDTNRAIQRVAERHEETEKQQKEAQKQHKEMQKAIAETQKQHKETEKAIVETQKAIEETQKSIEETQKSIKGLSKQMGILGNRFGEVAEHMVFPAVVARFNELGYRFHKEFEGNFKVINKKNQLIAEIDAYLENDTTIAVVEIKAKPDEEDVKDHVQRIEKLRQNRKEFNEPSKIIIGAIAGAVFPEKIKTVAIKAGFYVLVQSGDTMKFDVPKNFKPKEF
ncbi:MAG: hypothetical protein LBC02_02305 [Planctomycetaceae bacterium]|jgi:hypothetical protein|nr:hypothetical protein [Planctomycetaceae bacterium]